MAPDSPGELTEKADYDDRDHNSPVWLNFIFVVALIFVFVFALAFVFVFVFVSVFVFFYRTMVR